MRNSIQVAATAAFLVLAAMGCGRDSGTLAPATADTNPVVFDDNYSAGMTYEAFLNTKLDAVLIDPTERAVGTSSLKITVPDPDPVEWFAGGAFTTNAVRDLSGYNAVTFWAKADKAATLDVIGFGNDNTGTSRYEASSSNFELTTTWEKFIVPIPDPSKLTQERGLFFFAEGHEDNAGYNFWLDDIRFESVGVITNPRPVIKTETVGSFVGASVKVAGTEVTFNVDGVDRTVQHLPGYMSFTSSDEAVAVVRDGTIEVLGPGSAEITASLAGVSATGKVTLEASTAPTEAAPTPTVPAADVISIFSDAYDDITVDTFLADWSRDFANLTDYDINGDAVKAYTNLQFAGIEFATELIDATGMTHFHIDVWVPDGPYIVKVKLVDFGEDGTYLGAPDSERELIFATSTTPPLVPGTWTQFEIPIEDFMGSPTGLFQRAHLAQLIVGGTGNTAFFDNIYFHK